MKKAKLATLVSGLVLVGAVAMRLYAAVSISSTNVPLAIPDAGSTTSTLNWTIGSGTGPVATDVNVLVNITHTWDGDVAVALAGPGTGTFTVWNNCGGSTDNFNVVIDDAGAATMPCATAQTAPISGTFQSSTSTVGSGSGQTNRTANATRMSSFNVNPFGTWTLTAVDDSAVCTGTLNSWSLTINGPAPLPVELMRIDTN